MVGRERDIARKYASGAQQRKKAKKRQKITDKEKNSLLNFVTKQPRLAANIENVESVIINQNSNSANENSSTQQDEVIQPTGIFEPEVDNNPNYDNNIGNQEIAEANGEPFNIHIVYSDPSTWPDLVNDTLRLTIIKSLQSQSKQTLLNEYPKDSSGRSFSSFYYQRKLKNGSSICRKWLLYSQIANKVYCYVCKLFSGSSDLQLVRTGSSDWKHMSENLKSHEQSSDHFKYMENLNELLFRFSSNSTIGNKTIQLMQKEKLHWRNVLERIVGIVHYLSKNNLAFRGSSDVIDTANNGNFLQLVQLFAKFDSVMGEHIRRIKNNEIHKHYLGKIIQNEITSLMAKKVTDSICDRINEAKYFAIILDCTPDISHTEQMSVIVRCVSIKELVTIEEHFMGFVTLNAQTGEALTEHAVQFISKLNLNIQNLRAQSYDNAATMTGKYKGVKSRILQLENRAFFTPCSSHSLNLLLADSAKSSTEAMKFFGVVQRLFTFFSASTNRWAIMKSKLSLSLKPLSETRWECRYESVKVLRYQLPKIEDCLHEIKDSAIDSALYSEASSLIDTITKYEFILKIVVWHDLLIKIHSMSKYMQQVDFQIDVAINQLSKITKFMQTYRDTGLSSAEVDSRDICEEMNVPRTFEIKRVQRKRKQFTYESVDCTFEDPKERFRNFFFYIVMDTIISCLKNRFKELKFHENNFGFLYNISNLNDKPSIDLLKLCKNLQKLLTDRKDSSISDIDGEELCDELKIICHTIPENLTVLETLNYLVKKNLANIYPNITAERSFSKLKIIKTYLRSTLTQERLNSLAILSIESDIAESLDYSDLIDEFSSMKARKVTF